VNVSSRELLRPDFVASVASALTDSGLAGSKLTVEITEAATVVDPERVREHLDALKAIDVRIALDDFGTGFSSLSNLRDFPVDYLKLDRSFVRDVARSIDDRAVVRGIIGISHGLGVPTIAEGVEAEVQRDTLRELGCDFGQGYLWTRPVPIGAACESAQLAIRCHRRRRP